MNRRVGFISLLLFLSFLNYGCSTFQIPARYIAVNQLSNNLGNGEKIGLLVIDDRSDKTLLGITEDVYKRRIELDRPAVTVVDDAFRQALSSVGFIISENAPAILEVKVVDTHAVWAAKFFNEVRADVSMDLRILSRNGRMVGSKRYSDSGQESKGFSSDGVKEGTHALSVVLSRVVDKAVSDPAFRNLYNEAKEGGAAPRLNPTAKAEEGVIVVSPSSRLELPLQYTGFSVKRPNYLTWNVDAKEQNNTSALFRRDLKTSTHTYYAAVELQSISRKPSSLEDFAEIEKEFHKIQNTQRFELLQYTQKVEKRQNQWCIYYEEKIIDHNAPNSGGKPLIGRSCGFVILHPSFNKTVVHAFYSERGLENELDPKLIEEGEDFLRGIQIESAPGKPVS